MSCMYIPTNTNITKMSVSPLRVSWACREISKPTKYQHTIKHTQTYRSFTKMSVLWLLGHSLNLTNTSLLPLTRHPHTHFIIALRLNSSFNWESTSTIWLGSSLCGQASRRKYSEPKRKGPTEDKPGMLIPHPYTHTHTIRGSSFNTRKSIYHNARCKTVS